MKFQDLRRELKDYYSKKSYENAEKYLEKGKKILDAAYSEDMTPYEMKVLQ